MQQPLRMRLICIESPLHTDQPLEFGLQDRDGNLVGLRSPGGAWIKRIKASLGRRRPGEQCRRWRTGGNSRRQSRRNYSVAITLALGVG